MMQAASLEELLALRKRLLNYHTVSKCCDIEPAVALSANALRPGS